LQFRLPNRYLRTETEERAGALVQAFGLGLSVAGAMALALRPGIMASAAVFSFLYFMALFFTITTGCIYRSAWGTPARPRLRHSLYVAILFSIVLGITLLIASGPPNIWGALLSIIAWAHALYFVRSARSGYIQNEIVHVGLSVVWILVAALATCGSSFGTILMGLTGLIAAGLYSAPYRPYLHAMGDFALIMVACTHYYIVWQQLP